MSLAIVAVTPDGIVLGADSAVTSQSQGQEYSLAGYPKILNRAGAVQAIAFVNDLAIGEPGRESWFYDWLRKFLRDVASSTNTMKTAAELAEALNRESLPHSQHHDIVLAAWERTEKEEDRWPTVWEVSTGKVRDEYTARRLLTEDDANTFVKARKQPGEGFPVLYFHTGVASGVASWLLNEATPKFAELIGEGIPTPDVEGVYD